MTYGNLQYAEARCTTCSTYIKNLETETYKDKTGKVRHKKCNRQVKLKPTPSKQTRNHKYFLKNMPKKIEKITGKNGLPYKHYCEYPDCNKPIPAHAFSMRQPANQIDLCRNHLLSKNQTEIQKKFQDDANRKESFKKLVS